MKELIKDIVVRSDFLSALRRWFRAGVGALSFYRMRKSYGKTTYGARINMYKGVYEGQRCFIIGNGPSLRPGDLELLRNEYTFAANRIHLMYDRTRWRPTFYLCQDKDMLKAEEENIRKIQCDCFIGYNSMVRNGTCLANVNAYLMDDRAILRRKKKIPFSYDCEKTVVDASTVTYSSIQLAVYMGFSQIYLLGMDHHFPHTIDKNRRITYDASVQSHFDTRYKDVYKAAEQKKKIVLAVYDKEMAEEAYKSALEAAGQMGTEIYNATRGGELEVFPRVRLEQVI